MNKTLLICSGKVKNDNLLLNVQMADLKTIEKYWELSMPLVNKFKYIRDDVIW